MKKEEEDVLYILEQESYTSIQCGCRPYARACEHVTWTGVWYLRNSGFNLSALQGQRTRIIRTGGYGEERVRIRMMPTEFFIPLAHTADEMAQLLERAMTQIAQRQLLVETGAVAPPQRHRRGADKRWHRDGSSCTRKTCATEHVEKPTSGEARAYRESISGVCEACDGKGKRVYAYGGQGVAPQDVSCYSCAGTGVSRGR